jgi:hypothetical protein
MCPCNRPDLRDDGIVCVYHGWYAEYRTNKLVAAELGISILELPQVDIVLFAQAVAVLNAEAMANEKPDEPPASPTVH